VREDPDDRERRRDRRRGKEHGQDEGKGSEDEDEDGQRNRDRGVELTHLRVTREDVVGVLGDRGRSGDVELSVRDLPGCGAHPVRVVLGVGRLEGRGHGRRGSADRYRAGRDKASGGDLVGHPLPDALERRKRLGGRVAWIRLVHELERAVGALPEVVVQDLLGLRRVATRNREAIREEFREAAGGDPRDEEHDHPGGDDRPAVANHRKCPAFHRGALRSKLALANLTRRAGSRQAPGAAAGGLSSPRPVGVSDGGEPDVDCKGGRPSGGSSGSAEVAHQRSLIQG